jgi:hypothetical protein
VTEVISGIDGHGKSIPAQEFRQTQCELGAADATGNCRNSWAGMNSGSYFNYDDTVLPW